jgi:hypothetical protein
MIWSVRCRLVRVFYPLRRRPCPSRTFPGRMWLRPLLVANEPNAAVTAGRRTLARVDCRRRGRGFPGHPGTGRGPNGPAACGVRAWQPQPLWSRPSLLGQGPQRHLRLRRGRRCERGSSGHPTASGRRGMAAPLAPTPPTTFTRTRSLTPLFLYFISPAYLL